MSATKQGTQAGALWGARFADMPSEALTSISKSPDSYFRLMSQDIAGSRAHTYELGRQRLLTEEEVATLIDALNSIEDDWLNGDLQRDGASEDVHGYLEQQLLNRTGEIGGKIRAGRSRNDQTANDLRLYMRQEARNIIEHCQDLVDALIAQGEAQAKTHALGFTHLQAAQPITFGHQLLSHAQAISRDIRRLVVWDKENATSPLGAAALAGSAITTNPELMAKDLGYTNSYENSIDAVASRDHVSEFIFSATQLMISISRFSEEQILWASPHFKWITLHDSYSTGSSIMPQKKNPDIAELARGKSGTMMGILNGILATQKSLPTAYNRDLFEDKNAVIQAVDILELVLPAMVGSVKTMMVNDEVMKSQSTMGHALATDLADMLALEGVPFREAHEIVGETVSYCEKHNVELTDLNIDTLKDLDPRISVTMIDALDVETSLKKRRGKGSASPDRVLEQAEALRSRIKSPDFQLSALSGRALRTEKTSRGL